MAKYIMTSLVFICKVYYILPVIISIYTKKNLENLIEVKTRTKFKLVV